MRRRLIDFQRELVLLENFSAVNYTGFRKILKKYDKKTGLDLQCTYLLEVLDTPFFLSNSLRSLMGATVKQLHALGMFTKFRRTTMSSFGTAKAEQTVVYDFQPILKLLEDGTDQSATKLLMLLDDTSAEKLMINWDAAKDIQTLTFLMLSSTDDYFIGVCVLPPGEKVHFYHKEGNDIFTRLLHGKCIIRQAQDRLKERREKISKCHATGPWPSFRLTMGTCLEYENDSEENVLVLLITLSGFHGEIDQLTFPHDDADGDIDVAPHKRVVTVLPTI